MSNPRSRQFRLEKKRRRRRERDAKRGKSEPGRGSEQKYVVRMVLPPDDREPDPGLLAEGFSTLMSDTLVELMAPYIHWPPARHELDDLEEWLHLGAEVWNVTVEASDGMAYQRALTQLAAELDEEDALALVEEIAARKRELFARDRRHVLGVRLIEKNGYTSVEAATFLSLPGTSR